MKTKDTIFNATTMMIRGLLTGLITGVLITLFTLAIHLAWKLNTTYRFLIFLIPLASLFTLFLYKKYGESYKKTTDIAISEINTLSHRESRSILKGTAKEICPQMGILAFFTTFLTHLSGASGGKEGAGVQIGFASASIAQSIEEWVTEKLFKRTPKYGNYYLMCGAGAAFGALFNAPIAGVLFATQLASPKMSRYDAIFPCLLATYSSVYISQRLGAHILSIPEVVEIPFNMRNLIIVLVFASLVGLYSRFFCYFIYAIKNYLKSKFHSHYHRVLCMSILLTILSFVFYFVLGTFKYNGLGPILLTEMINGTANNYDHLIKFLFVLLTFTSGFMGGEVVPLFIIGSGFGLMFANIFALPVSAFATLGAIGMLAGGTNLPYVCFALGIELFGYHEISLLFLAANISFITSGKNGIYHKQMPAMD